MFSQTEIHEAIQKLEVQDEDKLLIFAAARVLFLAKITLDIQDMGEEIRLTGALPYNFGLGRELNRLGVVKNELHCYTYSKRL